MPPSRPARPRRAACTPRSWCSVGGAEGPLGRSNFWRLWTSASEAAGVAGQVENPVTGRIERWPHVHDVRHAFASCLHALGVPEADAQKILGHERGAKITWLYTHASAGSVDAVRAALDRGGLRVVS
ncbi:tyrosine-type recombinase/integrase [Streptomyces sp. NPDC058409]|uniref:tyrosine-type recombinase/integrase n=1 Tax=Streptomyces sp. NPDC058409 TaxID=3346484 RepID=UPI00364CB705